MEKNAGLQVSFLEDYRSTVRMLAIVADML